MIIPLWYTKNHHVLAIDTRRIIPWFVVLLFRFRMWRLGKMLRKKGYLP